MKKAPSLSQRAPSGWKLFRMDSRNISCAKRLSLIANSEKKPPPCSNTRKQASRLSQKPIQAAPAVEKSFDSRCEAQAPFLSRFISFCRSLASVGSPFDLRDLTSVSWVLQCKAFARPTDNKEGLGF